MKAVTPTNITPSTGSWLDVDVSAYVGADAGSVAGVVLEIINTGAEYSFGVRNNGSTDTYYRIQEDTGHEWVYIGVDSNNIFEANIENAAVQIWLHGYCTTAEAFFKTNGVDVTPGTQDAWIDVDLTAQADGSDTILCAFFLVDESGATRNFGMRENGSTDARLALHNSGDLGGAAMSVDAGEIVEIYADGSSTDFIFVGYLKDNFTSFANAKDYSTATTGSYVDVDMSSDIPAGNTGAFLHNHPSDGIEYTFNVIKKGAGTDRYYDASDHTYLWIEIDTNRVAEQKIENAAADLWLWGYTSAPAAGGFQAAWARNSNQIIGVSR